MESSNKPNNAYSAAADGDTLIQSPPNSTSANGDFETSDHPLLNPLVVGKIVEQLNPSFEQLKTFRLVCKVWTEVTLHHWRNSCAVLTLLPEHPSFFTQPEFKNGVTVSQFFTEFQDPQSPLQLSEKPFSKYKFKGLTFDIRECNKNGGPAQIFWNAIGPLIESVHFENCIFLKPEREDNEISEVKTMTVTCPMAQLLIGFIPNVKHLVVKVDGTEEQEAADFQVFAEKPHLNLQTLTFYGDTDTEEMNLKDLLKMAPNLESITGMDLPMMAMTEQALLEPIYEVRLKPKSSRDPAPAPLSNLKQLDLINSSSCLEIDNIWQFVIPSKAGNFTQLPLESLSMFLESEPEYLGNAEDSHATRKLEEYLKSFCGTLKTLEILRLPLGPPHSSFLGGTWGGEMSLLNELHLWGTITPDLSFLKNTPNLKRLRVDLGCFGKRDQLRDWIRKHSDDYDERVKYRKYEGDLVMNVKADLRDGILCSELEHLEIDFEFPKESLRLLGKWMPNLKRLETILNVETVPVVCELWRDLTELVCLHGSKIENSCFVREEEKASFSRGPPTKLKICDLNELERFELDTYCGESELTDDVVLKGFLKMSGLKSVKICVNSQMTVKAEEALRQGIPFCKVIRNMPVAKMGSADEDASDSGICGCDRCDFRREAEKVYPKTDDEDGEGLSFTVSGESGEEGEDVADDTDDSGESDDSAASWEGDGDFGDGVNDSEFSD